MGWVGRCGFRERGVVGLGRLIKSLEWHFWY